MDAELWVLDGRSILPEPIKSVGAQFGIPHRVHSGGNGLATRRFRGTGFMERRHASLVRFDVCELDYLGPLLHVF
jgi:hypothetical protein